MTLHSWFAPFALLGALALASCSATKARISENEALFSSYSPDVQTMIRSNRIGLGFDSNQVYMALGRAHKTEFEDGQEVWYYLSTHQQTVQEEKSATEYAQDLHDYEAAVQAGQTGLAKPSTHTSYKLYRTGVSRLVRFEGGQVVSWDEPVDMWLDEWHQ